MAVITKARAAGAKYIPKDNIPNTQNAMDRTARTHRTRLLGHGLGPQYKTASNAKAVKTTGTSRGSSAQMPLTSMNEAE